MLLLEMDLWSRAKSLRQAANESVLCRMQLKRHATRRTPHASRLVQAMPAWSVETRRAPSRHRHCRAADPINVAARILEGRFDALSVAEGCVVVGRSEQKNYISKSGSAAFLARFGSG